jgi:DNA topoisomerase IB
MDEEEEVARKSKAMEKIEQSMVLLMSRTKHEVKNGKNTFFSENFSHPKKTKS